MADGALERRESLVVIVDRIDAVVFRALVIGTRLHHVYICRGSHAIALQHEFDHLNGKVYLDRMRDLTTLTFLQEFTRYWLRS